MSFFYWCSLVCVLLVVGQAVAKRTDTKVKRASSCGDGHYECSNGECIQEEWLCDTEDDCGNNEDEVGCPTDCSGDHQVKCTNANCVPLEYRCDGDNDCGDGTDEQQCDTWKCPPFEVKCANNIVCVDLEYFCDGDSDCPDASDELTANCPATTVSG